MPAAGDPKVLVLACYIRRWMGDSVRRVLDVHRTALGDQTKDAKTMDDPNQCAPDDLKRDGTQGDHHDQKTKDAQTKDAQTKDAKTKDAKTKDAKQMDDRNHCAPDDLTRDGRLGGNPDGRRDLKRRAKS